MIALSGVSVPAALSAVRAGDPDWDRWVAGLPRLLGGLLDEWGLGLEGAAAHGRAGIVLPVRDERGRALALKCGFVEGDNAGEIPALKAWRADGAVRLERADPRRGALLLERLGPADLSSVAEDEANATLSGLYRRLHIPAPPTVPVLAPRLTRWLDRLDALGRAAPAPPRFVQQALQAGRDLVADDPPGGPRVLHGDLHGGNVLAGTREPWLVIDPKGFAGDPCYEPGPALWNRWGDLVVTGDVGSAIRRRFWALIDGAELDERRARDWVVVRAMVSVSWVVEDAERAGRPLSAASTEWITRCVTVAKAMQAVGAW